MALTTTGRGELRSLAGFNGEKGAALVPPLDTRAGVIERALPPSPIRTTKVTGDP
jgi:hypothetical protein